MIGLRGIKFPDNGSCLMLAAIAAHYAERGQAQQLCLDACSGCFRQIVGLGYVDQYWAVRPPPHPDAMAGLIPSRVRKRVKMFPADSIDVVLDASGFVYSDLFGPRAAERADEAAAFLRRWKRGSRRYVFLPQAFGPFNNSELRRSFSAAAEHADLIFARDRTALLHLYELLGPQPKIQLAPDFTNILSAAPTGIPATKYACIIIEGRVSAPGRADAQVEQRLLLECHRVLRASGLTVVIAVNGTDDLEYGRELIAEGARLFTAADPLGIRALAGAAHLVISSHYHGLVSALSQGIPCIAAGWNHGGEELLADYGLIDSMLHEQSDADRVSSVLNALLEQHGAVSERLKHLAEEKKKQTRVMWQSVDRLSTPAVSAPAPHERSDTARGSRAPHPLS